MYREDNSELEQLIYEAGKVYVPLGTVFVLTGYSFMDIHLIFAGVTILTFVLYLYYILFKDIYGQR